MADAPSAGERGGDYWVSIADLMSGLMVLFLFIAVAYMSKVIKEQARIVKVAVAWEESKGSLYKKLTTEFAKDTAVWNAEIASIWLAVRFKEPDVLFEPGSALVKPRFQEIMSDFLSKKDKTTMMLTCGASCPDAVMEAVLLKILSFFKTTKEIDELLLAL